MFGEFLIAGGSVMGTEHREVPRNNEDAYAWLEMPSALAAVVCDGNGSGEHTEVGAKMGAKLILASIRQTLRFHPEYEVVSVEFWERVRGLCLIRIGTWIGDLIGKPLPEDFEKQVVRFVNEYFLFTIIGVLITQRDTVLFSIGDGLQVVNDDVIPLGPFEDNTPPYLSYGLIESHVRKMDTQRWRFRTSHYDTQVVSGVMIGTDGMHKFIAAQNLPIPGASDRLVGPLTQFWHDRYFRNADNIRRRLEICNSQGHAIDWENRVVKPYYGHLIDDATLVVVRRR